MRLLTSLSPCCTLRRQLVQIFRPQEQVTLRLLASRNTHENEKATRNNLIRPPVHDLPLLGGRRDHFLPYYEIRNSDWVPKDSDQPSTRKVLVSILHYLMRLRTMRSSACFQKSWSQHPLQTQTTPKVLPSPWDGDHSTTNHTRIPYPVHHTVGECSQFAANCAILVTTSRE